MIVYERPAHRQFVAAWIGTGVVWVVLLGILLLVLACGSIPVGAINPYCWRNCFNAPVAVTGNRADQLNPTLGDTAVTATRTQTK